VKRTTQPVHTLPADFMRNRDPWVRNVDAMITWLIFARWRGDDEARAYVKRMSNAHAVVKDSTKRDLRATLREALDLANATHWRDPKGNLRGRGLGDPKLRELRVEIARDIIERRAPQVKISDATLTEAVEEWPLSRRGKWPAVRALAREMGCDAPNLRVLLHKS
jgi:hypothetical protein